MRPRTTAVLPRLTGLMQRGHVRRVEQRMNRGLKVNKGFYV
jgi:hypothetical protein